MEFRQLQYVAAVAELGSFTKAAEKLLLAQPSLSQQIAKLESELGMLIFHRSSQKITLTRPGEVFLEKAQYMLVLRDELLDQMADLSEARSGSLVIGSLPITGSHLLPRLLPRFRAAFPHIELTLREEPSSELAALTANGETDISLLTLPLEDPSLELIHLIKEEICAAVPNDHPLLLQGKPTKDHAFPSIPLASLANESFITLKPGQGFRKLTTEICEQAGFSPRIVFESSNIETVQALVAAGMGVALVPYMVASSRQQTPAAAYLSVTEPSPTRSIVLARRKERYVTRAVQAFIDLAVHNVQDGDHPKY